MTMIDGSIVTGLAEPGVEKMKNGTFLQFESVGFAKIYQAGDPIQVSFAHK
jgi:hypothetical protein